MDSNLKEEIERLQKVVADQALTIGLLKAEVGRLTQGPDYGLQYATPTGIKSAWQINQEVEALRAERTAYKASWEEVQHLLPAVREEAQTARLALDVALKEVERLKAHNDLAQEVIRCAREFDELDFDDHDACIQEVFEAARTLARDAEANPPPGAAPEVLDEQARTKQFEALAQFTRLDAKTFFVVDAPQETDDVEVLCTRCSHDVRRHILEKGERCECRDCDCIEFQDPRQPGGPTVRFPREADFDPSYNDNKTKPGDAT